MAKNQSGPPSGVERRRTVRKSVLETFHVFVVIPHKGLRKIYLKDVSEGGIGLYAEPEDQFAKGDELELDFYINPSLHLPLKLRVMHDGSENTPEGPRRKIGCEFADTSAKPYKAYVAFINLLDQLVEFVS